jgi:hypothetical protein
MDCRAGPDFTGLDAPRGGLSAVSWLIFLGFEPGSGRLPIVPIREPYRSRNRNADFRFFTLATL